MIIIVKFVKNIRSEYLQPLYPKSLLEFIKFRISFHACMSSKHTLYYYFLLHSKTPNLILSVLNVSKRNETTFSVRYKLSIIFRDESKLGSRLFGYLMIAFYRDFIRIDFFPFFKVLEPSNCCAISLGAVFVHHSDDTSEYSTCIDRNIFSLYFIWVFF